jgi:transcriptional regulator with XRE-family HTH domain
MHIPSDPELLKTQLGIELRRLREEAGFTALEACAAINAHTPKLSKLENGNQTADPEDIRKLAEFYRRRRRKPAERDAVPDWFRRFLALEWDATEIRTYQVESVHGLLQTEAYARSNIMAWEPEADQRIIDKQVETRLGRQTVLKRNGRPSLRFEMLLSEAVLRRVQGNNSIMRGQLQHLITASKRPNITIRVLPFAVPDRIAMPSAFSLFRLQEQNFSTVYLEDLFGATYLKEPDEFTQYSVVFGRLRDAALHPEASREFLAKVAESYK